MKKVFVVMLAAAFLSGPAMAYMTLKSCQMISTSSGVKWLGRYCDAAGNCVQQLSDSYCPYVL